jgi:uncharacterized caspase-like protein
VNLGTCFGTAVLLSCAAYTAFPEEPQRSVRVVPPAEAEAVYNERRVALVIGNGGYAIGRLRNPTNDADDIAGVLEKRKFAVTLLKDANKQGMERAIKTFGETLKAGGGVGLFYYAGHGVQIDGVNYLIPIDEELEEEVDAKYRGIDAGMVVDFVRRAGNRMNIIILDACRDNPFHKSSRSGVRGLAQMDAPEGTLIAYATGPGQTAAEGRERNGLYTKYLLEKMVIPGQKVEEMFKTVRVAVVKDSNKKQVPWESSSLVGDFFFTPSDCYAKEKEDEKAEIERVDQERRDLDRLKAERAAKKEAIRLEQERIEQERLQEEENRRRAEEKRRSDFRRVATSSSSEGGVEKVKKGASFLEGLIKKIITPGGRVNDPMVAPP